MKKIWIYAAAGSGAAILVTFALRGLLGESTWWHRPSPLELPTACTLMEMPEKDRAAHEEQLRTLGRASRLVEKRSDGFTFEIDQRVMGREAIDQWIANEEKCCGMIKLSSEQTGEDTFVRVIVDVAPESRDEIIAAFGLK